MKRFTAFLLALLMLISCAFAEEEFTDAVPQEFGALNPGDENDDVRMLNDRLMAIGYLDVTGSAYDEKTVVAVTAVQKNYGLEETGIADADTMEVIFGDCFLPLYENDTGDKVQELQKALKELALFSDEVNGVYGLTTVQAVQIFQKLYGLEVTGQADVNTLATLYSDLTEKEILPEPTATPRPGEITVAGDKVVPYTRKLTVGSTGADVQKLQEKLKELGFFTYKKTTTNYQTQTKNAVTKFQEYNGLPATGDVDADTWNAIFNSLEVVPSDATPRPTASVSGVAFKKKLAYGSTGNEVKLVQDKLKELGFFTRAKTTNGYYSETQAAVKKFQEYNGLPVTGNVDKTTWDALFNNGETVPADATPRPSPEPTPAAFYVDVDCKNQVTKVYTFDENGEYTKLVRVMICSTGTTSYPSDVGVWTLTGRTARWCTFPKWGGGTAQYWTKINASIAFHSVIYSNYDSSKMNEKSFNNLGKRASHGCIRLTTADAKWVYENCGAGTQVYIHNDGNTDAETLAFAKYRKTNTSVMLPDMNSYKMEEIPGYRRLKSGSQGNDVFWLQMTLRELGYYTGTVTGYYATMTKSAVKKFQKANGISNDGVLGEKTYNKLVSIVNKELEKQRQEQEKPVEPIPEEAQQET